MHLKNLQLTSKNNNVTISLVNDKYVRKRGKNMAIVRENVRIEYDMITSVCEY